VGFTDQKPHRHLGQGHGVMPALPGAHLVLIHADFALASFKARFNAGARLEGIPVKRDISYHQSLSAIDDWRLRARGNSSIWANTVSNSL
jgi:hypothetical protein